MTEINLPSITRSSESKEEVPTEAQIEQAGRKEGTSYIPFYSRTYDDTLLKPAEKIRHGEGEQATKTFKYPPGNYNTEHEKLQRAAEHRFMKLVHRHMYPYGFNTVWSAPVINDKIVMPQEVPKLPLKAMKNRLWRKAVRRVIKRGTGIKPTRESMLPRPKLKSLFGKGFYSARGFAPHAAMAKIKVAGGAILATVASAAAPLIIKGVASLVDYISRKIKDKKKRDAYIKKVKEKMPETNAELKKEVEEVNKVAAAESAKQKSATTTSATTAAASGIVPTEYQMEQARDAATKAQNKGLIGMPNPLSYPKYPPRQPTSNDAISIARDIYDRARRGSELVASDLRIHPKYAIPYIDKFLRAHAKKTFGSGASKVILDTSIRSKPMKTFSLAKFMKGVLKHSLPSKKGQKKLSRYAKQAPLTTKGGSLSEILASAANFILGDESPIRSILPVALNAGVSLAKYIKKFMKKILPGTKISKEGQIELESLLSPFGEWTSEYLGDPGLEIVGEGAGKLITKGGAAFMDILAGLAQPVLESLPEVASSFAKKYLNPFLSYAVGKQGKNIPKALSYIGSRVADTLSEKAKAKAWKEAEAEVQKEEETGRKELRDISEKIEKERQRVEDIATKPRGERITDSIEDIQRQAEYARELAESLSSSFPSRKYAGYSTAEPSYGYSKSKGDKKKKWHMIPSDSSPGHLRREYLEDDDTYSFMKGSKKKDSLKKLEKKIRKAKLKKKLSSIVEPEIMKPKKKSKAKKLEKALRLAKLSRSLKEERSLMKPKKKKKSKASLLKKELKLARLQESLKEAKRRLKEDPSVEQERAIDKLKKEVEETKLQKTLIRETAAKEALEDNPYAEIPWERGKGLSSRGLTACGLTARGLTAMGIKTPEIKTNALEITRRYNQAISDSLQKINDNDQSRKIKEGRQGIVAGESVPEITGMRKKIISAM